MFVGELAISAWPHILQTHVAADLSHLPGGREAVEKQIRHHEAHAGS